MAKIFIVRHAQDEDNARSILNGRRDLGLTELGKQQAREVGSKLDDKNISVIFCGPQLRHRTTAQIISEALGGVAVIVNDDLVERDFGILTGRPLSDIKKYARQILVTDGVDYFLDVQGSESFESVYARAGHFLKYLSTQKQDGNSLVVTSGDTGKMIRATYNNWSWEYGLKTPHFDNVGVIELGSG